MRGIVTLAAALALPDAFPYRDLLLFTASCVVLGTLILQGLTLRPLMTALSFADDRIVEEEVRRARTEITRAALTILDGQEPSEATAVIRRDYQARLTDDSNDHQAYATTMPRLATLHTTPTAAP